MANYENAYTMDDLKKQVSNYQNFAAKESPVPAKDVFTSAVFDKATLQKLLDTDGTHGLRIYLAKSSEDETHDDVSYLVVPVSKENGVYTDLIHDDHEHVQSGAIAFADCIGKVCNGGALIDGNPMA